MKSSLKYLQRYKWFQRMDVYRCKKHYWLRTIVRNKRTNIPYFSSDHVRSMCTAAAAVPMWWNDEWKNPLQRQHQDSNGNSHNGMTSVCWKLLIKSEVASVYGRVQAKAKATAMKRIRKSIGTGRNFFFFLYLHPISLMPSRQNHWDCLKCASHSPPPIERISKGLVSQSQHFKATAHINRQYVVTTNIPINYCCLAPSLQTFNFLNSFIPFAWQSHRITCETSTNKMKVVLSISNHMCFFPLSFRLDEYCAYWKRIMFRPSNGSNQWLL